jgi:hypothetical protein
MRCGVHRGKQIGRTLELICEVNLPEKVVHLLANTIRLFTNVTPTKLYSDERANGPDFPTVWNTALFALQQWFIVFYNTRDTVKQTIATKRSKI